MPFEEIFSSREHRESIRLATLTSDREISKEYNVAKDCGAMIRRKGGCDALSAKRVDNEFTRRERNDEL